MGHTKESIAYTKNLSTYNFHLGCSWVILTLNLPDYCQDQYTYHPSCSFQQQTFLELNL